MLAGDRRSNEGLQKAFPLYPNGEFDFFYKRSPWPIGLKSTAPTNLKKKIAAAFISEAFGYSSMDRLMKKYESNLSYPEEDGSRLDIRIRGWAKTSMSDFHRSIMALSYSKKYQDFGSAMSGWTLSRAHFAVEIMAYSAQRGAIFEALCVVRSLIEQMAWSCAVKNLGEEDDLRAFQAQRCIASLKRASPRCGKLYGWLSSHAHWSVDAHSKSMISRDGYAGHLYASCYFKAISFAVMIILVLCYFELLNSLYYRPRSGLSELKCASPAALRKMRSVTSGFFSEILRLEADDDELLTLQDMLAMKGVQ